MHRIGSIDRLTVALPTARGSDTQMSWDAFFGRVCASPSTWACVEEAEGEVEGVVGRCRGSGCVHGETSKRKSDLIKSLNKFGEDCAL